MLGHPGVARRRGTPRRRGARRRSPAGSRRRARWRARSARRSVTVCGMSRMYGRAVPAGPASAWRCREEPTDRVAARRARGPPQQTARSSTASCVRAARATGHLRRSPPAQPDQSHAMQPQLDGQHHAGRSAAGNDHVTHDIPGIQGCTSTCARVLRNSLISARSAWRCRQKKPTDRVRACRARGTAPADRAGPCTSDAADVQPERSGRLRSGSAPFSSTTARCTPVQPQLAGQHRRRSVRRGDDRVNHEIPHHDQVARRQAARGQLRSSA